MIVMKDNGNVTNSPSQMQDVWFDNCLSPAASNLSFILNSPCGRLTPTQGEVVGLIGTPLSENNMLKNDTHFASHFSPSIFSPTKKFSKLLKKRDNSVRTSLKNNSKSIFHNDQFPTL